MGQDIPIELGRLVAERGGDGTDDPLEQLRVVRLQYGDGIAEPLYKLFRPLGRGGCIQIECRQTAGLRKGDEHKGRRFGRPQQRVSHGGGPRFQLS